MHIDFPLDPYAAYRHMKEINLCVYACMHAVYVRHASGVPHNCEATPIQALWGNGFIYHMTEIIARPSLYHTTTVQLLRMYDMLI